MEIKRRQFTLASMASRLVSATESAGLASMATFASALWVGLALPGLPLLPGLGAGGNSNVAISLSSAVLGVQESQTFKSPNNVTGRQARCGCGNLEAGDCCVHGSMLPAWTNE